MPPYSDEGIARLDYQVYLYGLKSLNACSDAAN